MESAEANAFFESCPECGGTVHRVARKCKHCGADLQQVRDSISEPGPGPEPKPEPEPDPEHRPPPLVPSPVLSPSPSPVLSPSTPTATSRRWMLAGAAVLILAVGMALGIMVERGSHPDRSRAAPARIEVATPQAPSFQLDRDDPDPGITLNWSFRSRSQRRAPAGGGPSVDEFVSRLGNELCEKITECGGADPAVGLLCRTIAANIQTDDVAAKIKSGECDYNAAAAAACIKGLEDLDCDVGGSSTDPLADPFALMLTIDSIMSCLEALSCPAW